jgi:hypothetical protein
MRGSPQPGLTPMPDNDALRLHFDVFELDEAQARLT